MPAYIVADVPPSDHQVDKGKTYTHYLLVESVHTPKGPRQHVVCSLGSLAPAPREEWLSLAHRLEASLEDRVRFMSLPTILFALNLGKLATESELSLNMLDPRRRHGRDLAQTRLLWTRPDGR